MEYLIRRSYDPELYHHGIKGMKWGVRRFQKKDGSLTKAGLKRYDNDPTNGVPEKKESKFNPLERHKNKLIDKYKERGYSQEAAETAAKKRIQTELFVGAVAAVAVTVVASKAAVRIGQDYFDKTIKSGEIIQNIGAYENADFKNNPFFAAVNNSDKKAYGNLYPAEKRGMQIMKGDYTPKIFKNQIKITKDVKMASINNAKKIFEEQMEQDPSFRKNVINTLKKTAYGQMGDNAVGNYEKTGKVTRKLYDRFNQALATPEMQDSGLHKQFYSKMKEKGYDAILDINDTRYSGYKNIAKSPTIFFGGDKLEKIGATRIDDVKIDENANRFAAEFVAKKLAKDTAKKAAIVGAIAGGAKLASDQQKIEKYLDEHPNSKLSDKEILRAIDEESLRKLYQM